MSLLERMEKNVPLWLVLMWMGVAVYYYLWGCKVWNFYDAERRVSLSLYDELTKYRAADPTTKPKEEVPDGHG